MTEMVTDEQRSDCWDKAIHAFGTAFIFEQRVIKARRNVRLLSFSGIALPVLIGGIVVAFFGFDSMKTAVSVLIVLAALLATVQLVFTIWSLVAKWDDQAIYGSESSIANNEISRAYADLAKNVPADFDSKYALLNVRNDMRSNDDGKKEITEPEKRMGMRAALRKFQRACVECEKVPVDLNPTDCPICGNYKA